MPWNALFLPLVGGFLFYSQWNRTKYNSTRSDGQRLVLESALWGVCLLIVSYTVVRILLIFLPSIHSWWRIIVVYPGIGAPAGAMLLGLILPHILNLFWQEAAENRRSYRSFSDYFGSLLFQAQLEDRPTAIDLRNGKVYVGKVIECNSPGKHDGGGSILIQPLLSGFRSRLRHELILTTDYTLRTQQIIGKVEAAASALKEANNKYYEAMKTNEQHKIRDFQHALRLTDKRYSDTIADANARLSAFQIAISTSDVVTVRPFDRHMFAMFNPAFTP